MNDGFEFTMKGNDFTVILNSIYYGSITFCNGLYVLDLDKVMLNLEVKKPRKNDPSQTYIWHCRLGHINETRIVKLHKQGYLDPFDYELYWPCECCLLGKMTKTLFTRKGERAGVLLRLIH